MKRDPKIYIQDILEAITRIEQYTKELTYDEFTKDNKTIDATIRNFAVIGEAAKNIPATLKKKHNEIPWRRMAGMRDKIIHQYFGVDPKILWNTAKTDLPTIKPLLKKLITETTQ